MTPAAFVTWFRAQRACKNARKRLPSNAEWRAAVAGTPHPGPDDETDDRNTSGPPFAVSSTGSRSACLSADGAFDMVGNPFEYVAEWVPRSPDCGSWRGSVSPTADVQCLAGAATTGEPGAVQRGGGFAAGMLGGGPSAGPLDIRAFFTPSDGGFDDFGFRCAR